MTFLLMVMPAGGDDGRDRPARRGLDRGPVRRGPWSTARCRWRSSASTSRCSPALTALLGDSLDQRQVVLLVLLLSAVLYAPLRQRLWLGRPAGRARRPRQPVRRRRRARLHPRDDRRGAGPAGGGRRRGGVRVRGGVRPGRGRPRRRRAAGRHPRRPRRTRRARCRSPTATRRSAGWCCRPAGCAAGSRAATRSCSATWSGRRPPRPAPAGWPTSCRRAGSGWSSPARRSAAGSAATCTTASARR